jgi:hypothetical protein
LEQLRFLDDGGARQFRVNLLLQVTKREGAIQDEAECEGAEQQ